MILGFKEQFNKPILDGTKIHSIRAGSRWRAGMKIHYYNSVRTKRMRKFKEDGICISVQWFNINWDTGLAKASVDGRHLDMGEVSMLAENDGFPDILSLLRWFYGYSNFDGQIVHWTDFKY